MSFETGPRRTKWWKPDWVIDTRCWLHQTGTLQLLHDVTTRDLNDMANTHRALGGPNDQPLIVGSGTVKYEEKIKVPNVRYIPAEKDNIISVAQLSRDHGLETVFGPKYCYIRKQEGQVNVGWGRFRNGKYVLEYLIINENGEIKEATPDITSDADDEASQAQASSDDLHKLFGLARFGRCSPPPLVVNNFCCDHACTRGSMTPPDQQERSDHLFMDSGAAFHSTWNPHAIAHYFPQVRPPTESLGGFLGAGQEPKGYGYIRTEDIKVEGVMYMPSSSHNLISVGQLTFMYNVSIGFTVNRFWIKEELTRKIVGHGRRLGGSNHYVLEKFVPSKPLHVDQLAPADSPPAAAPDLAPRARR